MKRDDVRQTLMNNAIRIIASDGLDKATTKRIAAEASVNEVYIYRNFADKEDMYSKIFAFLDDELLAKLMEHIPIMYMNDLAFEVRARMFFNAVWRFVLGNREKCLTFVRYFYSQYFVKFSSKEHREKYKIFLEKIKPAFKEEANVWMLLNYMLHSMLDFAIKVYNDDLPDDEDTSEHVFRVIYAAVKQYFKIEENFNL